MENELVEKIVSDLRSRLLACSAESAHYEIYIDKNGSWLIFMASPVAIGKEFERKLP